MGIPNYPKSFADEWTQIKRDVKNAYTSANLRTGMAKIGAKVIEITGELILNAGAKLIARYDNGRNAFYVQHLEYNGGTVGQTAINRYDGSLAFQVFGGEHDPGYVSIHDAAGNAILAEDGAERQGLQRPYLPYNFVQTSYIFLPPSLHTGGSFTAQWTVTGEQQHPVIRIQMRVYAQGGDQAQVRIFDPETGTVVAQTGTIGDSIIYLEGPHVSYDFGRDFKYDVEIRRTSGAGPGVGLTLLRAEGKQS